MPINKNQSSMKCINCNHNNLSIFCLQSKKIDTLCYYIVNCNNCNNVYKVVK